ncbi:unnamed protein product [Mesocestoides corti]|uniref:protein-serine/threonine phosphatase n=1 Tax=Mesocestoides corti TaxID=53468 RepID=A0A3P6HX57_MESCO|nr:unnamed protein product [Mesocestoides corti]
MKDEENLLASRKLALLIDLDQTVLHTTTTPHAFRYKVIIGGIHRFRLPGCPMIYHTRFRPHLTKFLKRMVKRFQMHICTFGNRAYAHQLASILDPERQYFCQRILSRDECFNPVTKSANLKALFPRGVHLVCIIDDRGDVWDWSPNLIQVQPYRYASVMQIISIKLLFALPQSLDDIVGRKVSSFANALFFPEIGDINGPPGRPLSMMPMPDFRALPPPPPPPPSPLCAPTDSSTSSSDEETPSPSNSPSSSAIISSAREGTAGSDCGEHQPDSQSEPKSTDGSKEKSKEDDTDVKKPKIASSFPPIADLGSPQQSIFEMSEEALDAFDADYLLRLEQILMEIHRRYYRAYDKHVAEISRLKAENQSIQEGSRCVRGYSQLADGIVSPFGVEPGGHGVVASCRRPDDMSLALASRTPTCWSSITLRWRMYLLSGIPHIANIMTQMRARVLGPSTHITLSGLTPTHRPARESLAGQIALGLGATLHNRLRFPKHDKPPAPSASTGVASLPVAKPRVYNLEPLVNSRKAGHFPTYIAHFWPYSSHKAFTTHLVACRQNTEKVAAARAYLAKSHRQPLHIVSPRWLWASHFRWQRLPEVQFPLDHDYNLNMFDPDANCFPGYYRHRHHRYRHRPQFASRDPFEDVVSYDRPNHTFLSNHSLNDVAEDKPELSPSMVRSAMESIERELHDRRCRRNRSEKLCLLEGEVEPKRKRAVSESGEQSDPVCPQTRKRPCTRKSDGHLSIVDKDVSERCEDTEGNHSTSRSPSISTDDDDGDADSNLEGKKVESISEGGFSLPSPIPPSESIDNPGTSEEENDPDDVAVVSDADEEDLNSTLAEEEEDEGADTNGEDEELPEGAPQPQEEDLKEQMKQYLPPPCPLEYAENPLLHMSPQVRFFLPFGIRNPSYAASQMLDEVEEAVMEEREERALSVPREMEDEESSSSSSADDEEAKCAYELDNYRDEEEDANEDDEVDDSDSHDGRGRDEQIHTHKDLEREERWLHEPRQKAFKNVRPTTTGCRSDSHEPPNYWSDPPVSDEYADLREFNTCPEGYDYVDAEQARELLRPETTRKSPTTKQADVGGGGGNYGGKKKPVIGAAGYLEVSLFGSEISSSSSESDSGGDDSDGDAVIKSDALKEFM